MLETAPQPKIKRKRKHVYYLKKSETNASIHTMIEGIMDPITTLVDSGSSKNFIDTNLVRNYEPPTEKLKNPRSVIAIDGKELPNKIRHRVKINVEVEGWTFEIPFYVMDLGDTNMILGLEWLQQADPDIDWKTMNVSWKEKPITAKGAKELPEIPEQFKEFSSVFSEALFKKLPEH